MRVPMQIPPSAKDDYIYDRETGVLHRVAVDGKPLAEPRLQTRLRSGYIACYIRGTQYAAHRVIWFLVTGECPPLQIDHINGVKTDNRFANLRLASPSQNTSNRGKFKNNGLPKGVKRGYRGKYNACISFNRKHIHLGTFDSEESAAAAYREAAAKYHREFARWS